MAIRLKTSNGKLEKDVVKAIQKCLFSWESCGVVLWWSRLNSGKVRVGAYFVQMCKPGTPDFIAILKGRNGQIVVVFIEAKSAIGKLRPEQVAFHKQHHNGETVFVLTIREVAHLNQFINDNGIDTVGDIKWPGKLDIP